jgi:hypothetical protein
MVQLYGLVWFLALLAALAALQRRLHFETQAVFLLLTGRAEVALVLFALLFFPGVLLHEVSHFVVARLLGVRTARFSLLPQVLPARASRTAARSGKVKSRPSGGARLQLGFVETVAVDPLREALIGTAPLIAGSAFTLYAGLLPLGLPTVWAKLVNGDLARFLDALVALRAQPDFFVWLYLVIAISSTMFPSPADRRAWLPVACVALLATGMALLVGAGPWMVEHLLPWIEAALGALAAGFGISAAAHLAALLPVTALRNLLAYLVASRARG